VDPQLTSESYNDLRTGRIKVPPVITIGPLAPDAKPDIPAYLEQSRRAAMSRELDAERRYGTHGVLLFGTIFFFSAILALLAARAEARSNNRWRGP
jgi:hypothetical protein